MKNIYCPWRSKYTSKDVFTKEQKNKNEEDCIFCKMIKEDKDEKNCILKRNKNSFVMLNTYPYNAGHLMILPYVHKSELSDLSPETRAEIIEEVNSCVEALKKSLNPDGFNIGINLGKDSGAGIPSHLHVHIVPRWQGDTNFMPVIAETKQISFDLKEIYKKIKAEL